MAKKSKRKIAKTQKAAKVNPSPVAKSSRPLRILGAVVQTTTVTSESGDTTFKQRLARILQQDKSGRIDAAQLSEATSEVRAGVMEELRKHGSTSQPFESVMLPEITNRRRARGVPLWVTGTLTALLVLVVLVWWAGQPPVGAEQALRRTESAIADKNAAEFERLVNIPTLADSVVKQVFGQPTTSQAAAGGSQADRLLADQFEATVRAHLQNLLKSGQNAGQHDGLADNLHDQILAAISAGRLPDQPGNLLGELWQQLGGERLRIGHPHVVAVGATSHHVIAELPLSRDDIKLDVALQVALAKDTTGGQNSQWQIVDLPNLAQVMGLVDQAEASAAAGVEPSAGNDPAGPLPSLADDNSFLDTTAGKAPVNVDVLQAAKDNHGHVIARLNLANVSGLPVHGLDIALVIGDANGRPLKQVMLHEAAPLAPTANVEKTYSVSLGKAKPEKYIAEVPLTALTVRATLVGAIQ